MFVEKLIYQLFPLVRNPASVIPELRKELYRSGYTVRSEKYITFMTYTARHPEGQRRPGHINLTARKGNHTFAFELNPGLLVRYKSIEKLLQTKASTKVIIIRGNLRNRSVFQNNLNRINTTLRKVHRSNFSGQLWLVILSESRIFKLCL